MFWVCFLLMEKSFPSILYQQESKTFWAVVTSITSPLFNLSLGQTTTVLPNSSSRCGNLICFNFFSAWVNSVFSVIQMSFEDNGSLEFANDSELNLSWVYWQGKHSATFRWRVRKEGDLLAPRQEQSGMGTRNDSFVLLHLEYNGLILFPLKAMAKAPLTEKQVWDVLSLSASWGLWYERKASELPWPKPQSNGTINYLGEKMQGR